MSSSKTGIFHCKFENEVVWLHSAKSKAKAAKQFQNIWPATELEGAVALAKNSKKRLIGLLG